MRVVVAPDSYKGSLTAKEVAEAIERGFKKVIRDIDVTNVPMADGGEGTVQSLVDATGGRLVEVEVSDPLLRKIKSFYGILGDGNTAVIEMAAASGLPLLSKEERNPLITTTYGTGELIKSALDMGCRNLILGIGGSATNDGGQGMAKALGVKFLDKNGQDVGIGGKSLGYLENIDISGLDRRISECKIVVACDVDNPLCGEKGASNVFGPQKGGNAEMINILDANLMRYGTIIKKQLEVDIINVPGAGAAGGLGAGLMAFLDAKLERGIDIVINASGLEDIIKGADLVITGEGRMDFQTAFGKTPYGVARLAARYGIPVIAIAGGLGDGYETLYDKGFDSIFPIVDKPMSLDYAIENGVTLVEKTAERLMKTINVGRLIDSKEVK